MPVPVRSIASSEGDTYSLLSQATTTMTIGDSLPAQLVRKSAKKGFTFNIMSVGPPGMGKTTLLSALFGKDLEVTKEKVSEQPYKDPLNKPISINSKTFEIEEKQVRLRLTVVESTNYGEALCLKNSYTPIVEFLDNQFSDYLKRESGFDRRNIPDKMIHCLFFFISALGHGLTKLDLEFLRAVHGRVHVVPIIARADALTLSERVAFKRRIKDDIERNGIMVYNMPDPLHDDSDDIKRCIKEIQAAMPFAVSAINRGSNNNLSERCLEWGKIDPYDREHSDFLLLKTMLHMQMPELSDTTRDAFYEEYRLRMMPKDHGSSTRDSSRVSSIISGHCSDRSSRGDHL